MADKRQGEEPSGRGRLLRYLPLAGILLAVAGIVLTGAHRSLTFEAFVDHQEPIRAMVADNRAAMLGLYMAVYVLAVTLSLPASAFLTTIGGYLFGWALGGISASVAATLGATCLFLIARTALGEHLRRRAGSRLERLASGFERQGFSYLLFLRLMPVVPFWLTNLAAAIFGLRLRPFVLATQIGMVPASFAFAFAGSGLDETIGAHQAARARCIAEGGRDCTMNLSAESLLTPQLLAALALLGVLALAPILVRVWRGWRSKGEMA